MDAKKKYAYRWLLDWALLEIRNQQSVAQRGLAWCRIIPFLSIEEKDRARFCAALADTFHHLACSSAVGFKDFQEERFWEDIDQLGRYRQGTPEQCHTLFEQLLQEQGGEGQSKVG